MILVLLLILVSIEQANTHEQKYASEEWTPGSEIYDKERCGLPLKEFAVNGRKPGRYRRYNEGLRDDDRDQKIMGGSAVKDGELPWVVSITLLPGGPGPEQRMLFCTGTLITKKHVVTAAHCFKGLKHIDEPESCYPDNHILPENVPKHINVSIGSVCLDNVPPMEEGSRCDSSHKMTTYKVVRAKYEHYFKGNCKNDDYALIELDREVDPAYANHACLLQFSNVHDWQTRANPVVSGWGQDALNYLSRGEPVVALNKLSTGPLWPKESCVEKWKGNDYPSDAICTQEKTTEDTCIGDSGGGLTSTFKVEGDTAGLINGRHFLLGLVSFGTDCGDMVKDSSLAPKAQVFTGVMYHTAAIDDFIGMRSTNHNFDDNIKEEQES